MILNSHSGNHATRIAIVIAIFAISLDAQVHYRKLPPETIAQRLAAAGDNQHQRGDYLRQQMLTAGCTAANLKDDPVSHTNEPNVVCILPGKTDRQIIVGAHYDFVPEGRGIVDNWSGAALLPSLIESINNEPREHTFVFIAFTGEEKGMLGSKSYVSHLSKEQRQAITAMINIDTLGLSSTKVWATDSSRPLVNALFNVANMIHVPLGVVNVDNVGQSDNDSFRDAKVPEICIHSVTNETIRVLHSRNDQLAAIHQEDYYDSYRLLSAYLAVIDVALDKPTSTPSSPSK
jgi:Zn-dependent M28 family amino/carboxypeptidase